jgi:hypothetical protein
MSISSILGMGKTMVIFKNVENAVDRVFPDLPWKSAIIGVPFLRLISLRKSFFDAIFSLLGF